MKRLNTWLIIKELSSFLNKLFLLQVKLLKVYKSVNNVLVYVNLIDKLIF